MKIKTCLGPGCENEFEAFPINKKYCSITCKNNARYDREDEDYSVLYDTSSDPVYKNAEVGMDFYSEEDESSNKFLRSEVSRLQRLVEKYKNSADQTYQGILDALSDNVKRIKIDPPKKTKATRAKELVLNPWNSDLQLGKVSPTYDSNIAAERVELYTDKILQYYTDYSSEYSITTAHVYFLGDIVEGENIFPTQPHLLDTSVFRQATVDGPSIYGAQLRRLLEVVDKVRVVGVIGNHGRLSRYANPESNMDRVLYQVLYWMFHDEPRIEFDIPQGHGESSFWAVDSIGKYSTLLVHGDQFGPPTTQNTYVKKIPAWRSGGIPVPFQDVAMGHYHQNVKLTIGNSVVRIAGSPESYNTFAQERLGVMGRPSQHLQLVDPESGVYWENDIYLD